MSKKILFSIVLSQFFCTSLWFVGNAISNELILKTLSKTLTVSDLTSSTQLGFILGTLIYAVFTLADRYSPSKVFFISGLLASLFNFLLLYPYLEPYQLVLFRFFTGFFLAGVYPVGMKIAADHFDKNLGKALGFLVGALVLGTASSHLIRSLTASLPFQYVVLFASILAILGSFIMLIFVKDGPFLKKTISIKFSEAFVGFKNPEFKAAAFGYFGHMWELYTFWAFIPFILRSFQESHKLVFDVSLLSFSIIAFGALACVVSGFWSLKYDSTYLAKVFLILSCCCCLVSPLVFIYGSASVFFIFMFLWGAVVIADSPLFSSLVAKNAPAESKGTALTFVNSVGFFITILSLQTTSFLQNIVDKRVLFMVLALGPILGLLALFKSNKAL